MKRYAFGLELVRSSVTLRPIRLASMRLSRSATREPASTIECSISERSIVTFSSIAE
jgi:hypothetical protein